METNQLIISKSRIHRIKVQGYSNYSDFEISEFAFGNRFAYIVCASITVLGVATANIYILAAMSIIALFGVILPHHPIDYIYNHLMANKMNKPKLPPRSKQLKFTCVVASIWLISTIILFYTGITIAGYVVGGILVCVSTLVSTTDFCIPSTIYNLIFNIDVEKNDLPTNK